MYYVLNRAQDWPWSTRWREEPQSGLWPRASSQSLGNALTSSALDVWESRAFSKPDVLLSAFLTNPLAFSVISLPTIGNFIFLLCGLLNAMLCYVDMKFCQFIFSLLIHISPNQMSPPWSFLLEGDTPVMHRNLLSSLLFCVPCGLERGIPRCVYCTPICICPWMI